MSKPASTVPSLRSTLASKAATLWENTNPLLLLKPLDDVDYYLDHETLFPTTTNPKHLDATEIDQMSLTLTDCFLELSKSPTLESESSPSLWKLYKKKSGITMFKQNVTKGSDMFKSIMEIQCDSNRVYSVLSNPEHLRHSTDHFVHFSNDLSFGIILHCDFN